MPTCSPAPARTRRAPPGVKTCAVEYHVLLYSVYELCVLDTIHVAPVEGVCWCAALPYFRRSLSLIDSKGLRPGLESMKVRFHLMSGTRHAPVNGFDLYLP